MPPAQNVRPPRVEGVLSENGEVRCPEGHLVGLAVEEGVEFFCRKCDVNVTLTLRMTKVAAIHNLARLIASV